MPGASRLNDRGLTFRVHEDEDGCRVTVRLSTSAFSGEGEAWFDRSELEDFARSIRTYPLQGEPELIGGLGGDAKSELAPQTTVSIRVYSIGQRGQLGTRVRLESDAYESTRPEEVGHMEAELLTSHQRLEQFATDLLSVLDQGGGEAVLAGERLV